MGAVAAGAVRAVWRPLAQLACARVPAVVEEVAVVAGA